jgi:hypothetical protein
MDWRLANGLKTLLEQVNRLYPSRSRASDGTIGDAAHAATKSEHNPNAAGVVTALDITHDPANGADMNKLAESLILSEDPRVWYIIFNRRIWQGGVWTPYYGDNPHDKHLHISADQKPSLYDKADPWQISKGDSEMPTRDQINIAFMAALNRPATERELKDYQAVEWTTFLMTLYNNNLDFRTKAANYDSLKAALDIARKQSAPAQPATSLTKDNVIRYLQDHLQ